MSSDGPVLMVGGTGALGSKVVEALLARQRPVRMLVRTPSRAREFADRGVELVQGDMMDPRSLLAAMEGADSVITSAAGYTKHSSNDSADIDVIGNRNLVDAAAAVGIRRFVLTSILTCDQTPQVPHFWHKRLVEERLVERDVPYVSLRPGGFIETVTLFGGDPFARKRLIYVGSKTVPFTFVHTPDLAENLAQAVDVAGVEGKHIDIGWTRPVTIGEVADIASQLLETHIRTTVIPGGALSASSALIGWANPTIKDMAKMFRWFRTGNYVADTTLQAQVFGTPPTPEAAIADYLTELGHRVTGKPTLRSLGEQR